MRSYSQTRVCFFQDEVYFQINTLLFLNEIHRGLGCLCLIILGVKHTAENKGRTMF